MPAAPAPPNPSAPNAPDANRPGRPRRVVVLGSTGSIGVNTLEVVAHLCRQGQPFEVVGLAAGNNVGRLIEQAQTHQPEAVAIADARHRDQLEAALPAGTAVYAGPDAALELTRALDATDLIAAVVGSAGLPATLAAIEKGWRIGLANKETLVAAGALVVPMLAKHGAELLPVDSEHSAIFQCLNSGACKDQPDARPPIDGCRRIVLTASGGPFREWDARRIQNATVKEALNHPTWDMGPKITIDSASMFNKALEIIEAHWLFGLPAERIEAIVHPQSVIHSFVEFIDGSVLAQLGPPDMKTPIQYALTYPDRAPGCSRAMDWTTLSEFTFERPDPEKFPALRLAYDVIRAGKTAGAVFNAANEQAVAAFLEEKISFGQIAELVDDALQGADLLEPDCLGVVLDADQNARRRVEERVRRLH